MAARVEEPQGQLQDQIETAAALQFRSRESEDRATSYLKGQLQGQRALEQLQAALRAKDEEIAPLKSRQGDRLNLVTPTAVKPLAAVADLPPTPAA